MKILQISSNWGHGGPGGIVKDLYSQIIKHGDRCLIAYGRGTIPDDIPSIKIGNSIDNYSHGFFSRLFDCAGFCSKKATRNLVKQIKKYNPDIIQIHNLLGYYIHVGELFSFLKDYGKPIVWTIHDCWPVTGHCINFEQIGCMKWVDGCNRCKLKNDYPQCVLFDLSKKNWLKKRNLFADIPNMEIVCPSNWLKNILNQSVFNNYPIHVINNGIDIATFKPTKSTIRKEYKLGNKIVLLAVAGVWSKMKGEELIYEIANKLDEKYVIVMIGKRKKEKVYKNIIHIDRTYDLKTLVEWYSSADLFINPTFGDNFPTVNLEALACGLPIVTNNTGGSPEVIDNVCGRVVYSKKAKEFIEKIEECLSLNISREECVRASKKFDKDYCFSKYIKIYESLEKQCRKQR